MTSSAQQGCGMTSSEEQRDRAMSSAQHGCRGFSVNSINSCVLKIPGDQQFLNIQNQQNNHATANVTKITFSSNLLFDVHMKLLTCICMLLYNKLLPDNLLIGQLHQ